jgi:ATP-binding cassette subfamily F protein uup
MNILSIDRLTKHVQDRPLFTDLSFGIDDRDRLGLIGPNGSGKTTLLRILAGTEDSDGGRVARAAQLHIAYLPQIPVFDPDKSVREALLSPVSMANARVSEEEIHRMITMLGDLDVTDLEQKISKLSGGMMKKVALVQTLCLDSDLLILDEPTNHLDAWTNIWLEEQLSEWRKAILLITHDRYFLENVTNRILELDQGKLYQYDGNYSYYLEKKAERESAEARAEHKASRLLKSELEWLRRQPKARGTKQKARIDRVEELAARRRKNGGRGFLFESGAKESQNRILEVKNLSMSYEGRSLFSKFDYTFRSRERLGVIGPNGCGKSTFFNILMGSVQPQTGSVVKGLHTRFGYFDQNSRDLNPREKVIDFVKRTAGELLERGDGVVMEAARLLDYFGFSDRMQHGLIERLSGGERRRLHLVLVLMTSPNFLILDEPTNDLDIPTLVLLEDFLTDFKGCVLVASHDRYFLDRVASSLLVYEDGNIDGFEGLASEYLEYTRAKREQEGEARKSGRDSKQSGQDAKAESSQKKSERAEKRRLTPAEIKEFRELERQIEQIEKRQKEVETELASPGSSYETLTALAAEHETLNKDYSQKLSRWEELAVIKEG